MLKHAGESEVLVGYLLLKWHRREMAEFALVAQSLTL